MSSTPTNSKTDALVFAGLWLVFFVMLAVLVRWAPGALAGAAVFTLAMTLVSLCVNGQVPRGRQARALLFPLLLGSLWWLGMTLPRPAVLVLSATGVFGAVAMVVSQQLAQRARARWMDAAAPIGWAVSAVLLTAVYLLVLTPIGLLRRLGGADPLQRRFEDAPSYWTERTKTVDRKREFRQY